MNHVLIVEDLEESNYYLQVLLEGNGYRVTTTRDGLEALAAARREPPDVVVSDALMPNMDGFSLCRAWMQDAGLRIIPFIFYSATFTTPDDEKLALGLGAVRYLIKPQEPEIFLVELANVLRERTKTGSFDQGRSLGDTAFHNFHDAVLLGKLQEKISELENSNEALRRSEKLSNSYLAKLEKSFFGTVTMAMTLSEIRDPSTAGHEQRVADVAVMIGAEMGFDERRQEGLRIAGFLHDVGKISIPSEILARPGPLSNSEYQLVKGHCQAGYEVLKDVEFPWPVAQVALQHHERLDGNGYPQGLKGEEILLEARIMAVADVVEAMSSHRPYRSALGIDKALAEVERGRGTEYDSEVVDICLKLFREKGWTIPK